MRFYDVTAEGRFLVAEPMETKNVGVVVAQHWDEELKSLEAR
jgi:hypothetical protein